MRLATFSVGQDMPHLGLLCDEGAVLDLTTASEHDPRLGSMLDLIDAGAGGLTAVQDLQQRAASGDAALEKHRHVLAEVRVHAPIPRPRKNVYCVGLNYRSHVEQNAAALGEAVKLPEIPLFFSKPVTAVIGPGEAIRLDPRLTQQLDYEVELALVIGRAGTWISSEEAPAHIFGYTIVNDVSARDLQWRTSQFLYGKGLDTYCPLGPVIVTPDELGDLASVITELLVNGESRQSEAAGNMLFKPAQVIEALSRGLTLEPGDVVSLGTPGGCGYQLTPPRFLQAGDTVECRVTGIGSLTNSVAPPPSG